LFSLGKISCYETFFNYPKLTERQSLLILILLTLFTDSCRKPVTEKPGQGHMTAMSGSFLTVDMQEVWKKIPWTVMNNIGDRFSLDYSKKTWVISPGKDSFVVSIPVQLNKYLFVFKTADKPEETNVYWVQLIPDSSCTDYTDYTGVQYWIDFQDWKIYGLKYEHNNITNHLKPVELAACPNWEQSMIRQGYFSVDETSGKILVNDNPAFPMGDGGDLDCPKNPNEPDRKSFIKRISDALGNIGDFLSGGSGGGGSNFLGPTGDYPNPGLGGSGGDYAGGGIIGNTPSNNGTGPTITGTSTDPDIPSQTDIHGFYWTRIESLEIYLQSHPKGLLDCEEINQLPMLVYQDIGSYEIPQSVINRINNIRSYNSPLYTENNFKIQKIEDAFGSVVNCDYFYIEISQLPYLNGAPNNGGTQMTASQLIEYFRTHLNDFIGNNINVSFQPYYHYIAGSVNIDETAKFNSSYTNSLGALVHIDMVDDGTVVESGYNQNNTTNHYHFTFTTMKTPLDYAHPVAGNRRFGIFKQGNSYYFYISGVDKTNDFSTTLANIDWLGNISFSAADELWQSVQQGMIQFVETHYGIIYDPQQAIIRPKWSIIKKFLKKEITLQQMKAELHCQ